MIVVACNTASAAAIEDLRGAFPVPFVGMVPGVKPAAARSRSGTVAILAKHLVVGAMTGRAEGSPGTEPATNVAQMDRVGGSSSEAVAPGRER